MARAKNALKAGKIMAICCKIDNLTLGYNRHPAVHHLNTDFKTASLTAIVGPNGAGKSTFLKALAGVVSPLEGRIVHSYAKPMHMQKKSNFVAYLPQIAHIDQSFPISVEEFIRYGLWVNHHSKTKREDRIIIYKAIEAVGLAGFEHRQIGQLSGGQLQRVLFARIIVQDASLILLDEVFNGVDSKTTDDLLEILHQWQLEGRTIIAALHDLEIVKSHFPQALLLARRLIAHGKTHETLTKENLYEARKMVEAFNPDAAYCEMTAL